MWRKLDPSLRWRVPQRGSMRAQVSMESNGKGVDIHGEKLRFKAGEVDFGEPGTNGQHSFYQLIHQGRVVPCEFIGVIRSQQSVYLKGEIVSNHDELMCNFFAQVRPRGGLTPRMPRHPQHDANTPRRTRTAVTCKGCAQADALALGKDAVELRSENVPDPLIPHKTFTGNRPSMSIMLPELNAYSVGQLLSMYENRIAVQVRAGSSTVRRFVCARHVHVPTRLGGPVPQQQQQPLRAARVRSGRVQGACVQGFVWNVNSFDQWGVELGKVLASKVRVTMNNCRTDERPVSGFNYSTTTLMQRYLDGKTQLSYPEPRDYFPVNILDEQGVEHPVTDESHGLWTE